MTAPTTFDRFKGIIALYGQDGFEKLQKSHVLIVGVGGVGSWICESLCRSGVGTLTLLDMDTIDVSNTNRQLHTNLYNYGKYKVDALKERLELINPEIKINTIKTELTKDNIEEILKKCPLFVADAIDKLEAKAALVNYLYQNKKIFIVSGGAGGKTDPSKVHICDLSLAHGDKLLKNLRDTLRRKYNFAKGGQKMKIWCSSSSEEVKKASLLNDDTTNLPRFGASMAVTATNGLSMAAFLIDKIVKQ